MRRAREGRLLLYLAFYAVNYYNARTPFAEWFDDRGWSQDVLPRVRELAAAAKSMSFAGLAIDQELYAQAGGAATASWSAHYPGVNHGDSVVRASAPHAATTSAPRRSDVPSAVQPVRLRIQPV